MTLSASNGFLVVGFDRGEAGRQVSAACSIRSGRFIMHDLDPVSSVNRDEAPISHGGVLQHGDGIAPAFQQQLVGRLRV